MKSTFWFCKPTSCILYYHEINILQIFASCNWWLIPKYSFPYISFSYTELEKSACCFRCNQVYVLRHLDRSSVLPIHLNWYREPMIGHSFVVVVVVFFNIEVQWLAPSSLKQRVKTSGKLKVQFSSHKLIYAFSRILLLLKAKCTGNNRVIQKWPFYWFSQALLPIKNDWWSRQLAFLPPEA